MIAGIAVCSVLIIATITGLCMVARAARYEARHDTFAAPADPDGTATSAWLRSVAAGPDRPAARARELHHELSPFPAAGWLDMLPPDPPPADTAPLPVAVCELGMPTEDYIDQLFAKYAEVTR